MRRIFFVLAAIVAFLSAARAEEATAVFAGGCFWCVESDFEKLEGVGEVVSGYSGGEKKNPTYHDHEGHLEAARIAYDPSVVSYRALVDYFLRHIDPLDAGGQFCDRGHSYTTAIFVANEDERAAAEAAIAEAEGVLGKKIVTPILPRGPFWAAEDYHQDYYKKNPRKYAYYRSACGRDARVRKLWGEH
ncbi:MAG: peptide-methionine (S)-S-oxide reductase MsrA [Amphiplicatus sp.]